MTVMLYKFPGKHMLHGIPCDYTIVEESEVDAKIAEGWARSPAEAEVKATKPGWPTPIEAKSVEEPLKNVLTEEEKTALKEPIEVESTLPKREDETPPETPSFKPPKKKVSKKKAKE